MSSLYDRIAKLEGYYAKPYWDVKQWSVGHGTRASGPNDVVDPAEARRRLQAEVDQARGYVTKVGSHLDPGTQDALTSLTYNVGPKAITGPTGLAAAVQSGDTAEIRRIMMQYNKADGRTLPGLVNRRRAEVGWIGQPSEAASPTAQPIPNVLASGYGRESGPGYTSPGPSYASAAPATPPPTGETSTSQSWLGKTLGLSPAVDKGVTGGIGAIAGAFGKSQGADNQQLAAARDAAMKETNAALSEDEQRQQAALKAVLSRRQRSAFA